LDIEKHFSNGRPRVNVRVIVDHIGGDPERFAELMRVFERGDRRVQQYAAWPISLVAQSHPELVKPYLGKLIGYLERSDVHNAVKRSVTRLLQFVELPKRLHGRVFSSCLDLVLEPSEPIAVRCFALTAAERIAKDHPALMSELKLAAEMQIEHASAGMKVRIRRLLSGK